MLGGEGRGVELAPPFAAIALTKLNASLAESYCLVGVGVALGEFDELVAKNGNPVGDDVPESGI